MTPQQTKAVRSTFARVTPHFRVAADLFYRRLFEMNPSLQQLFREDAMERGRKFMQALAVIVKSIDRMEEIHPLLEDLGRRHYRFGARPELFPSVRDALMWTLAETTGDAFDQDAREAWEQLYEEVAGVMIAAMATEASGIEKSAGRSAAAASNDGR